MQAILFLNGTILHSLGAFLGFPYWQAMGARKETAATWRMAHSAITAGAVCTIAIAAGFHLLRLPPFGEMAVVIGTLSSGYGFATGSTLAAVSGHRGLGHPGSGAHKAVVFFYVIGSLGSLCAGPFLVYGAYMNFVGR